MRSVVLLLYYKRFVVGYDISARAITPLLGNHSLDSCKRMRTKIVRARSGGIYTVPVGGWVVFDLSSTCLLNRQNQRKSYFKKKLNFSLLENTKLLFLVLLPLLPPHNIARGSLVKDAKANHVEEDGAGPDQIPRVVLLQRVPCPHVRKDTWECADRV